MKLDKAIAITAEAFVNKYDKSGEPYIMHCLQVMTNVAKYNDPELSVIAVLHDLIEDTSWFLETKAEHSPYNYTIADPGVGPLKISKRVYEALNLLTHKKHMGYEEYIAQICNNIDAIRVKMADIEHNSSILRLKGIREKDLARIAKYHQAYITLKQALKLKETICYAK